MTRVFANVQIVKISPPTALRFPELAVIKDHKEYQFLSYANVLLILWRGVQDPKVCSTAYDVAVDLAARNTVGRVAVLSIIEPGDRRRQPKRERP